MPTWITVNGSRVDLDQFPPGVREAIAAQADPPPAQQQTQQTQQQITTSQPEQIAAGTVLGHTGAGNPIVQQADGTRRVDTTRTLNSAGGYNTAVGTTPGPTLMPDAGVTPQQVFQKYAAPTPAAPAKPSPTSSVSRGSGITIGEDEDYRAAIGQALRSLGVVNVDPFLDDATVDRMALAKMDVEAITAAFATDERVLRINPGAQYGMTREQYFKGREGTEEAFSQKFGDTGTLSETRRRARNPQEVGAAQPEPDWMREVFEERFTPEQSADMFSDYFRRLGRAPSADEVGTYRTRSMERFGGRVVEPSYTPPWTREEKGERPRARELTSRGSGSSPFGRTG